MKRAEKIQKAVYERRVAEAGAGSRAAFHKQRAAASLQALVRITKDMGQDPYQWERALRIVQRKEQLTLFQPEPPAKRPAARAPRKWDSRAAAPKSNPGGYK